MVALNEFGSSMRDDLRGSMWWRKRCWCVAARSGCGLHMRDACRGSTWNRKEALVRGPVAQVRLAHARCLSWFHVEQGGRN